ncbi:MAG: MocR-like pyridoxine biosynthesis transcription factor PdxR [Anaerolineae bacterium]
MAMQINRQSEVPAYMQLRNHLREQILRGDLSPGTRLPPEREMARRLGVSRTTIVSAYDELVAEGLVEAHVGRGTVVLAPAPAGVAAAEAVQPIAWPAHFSSLAQRLQGPTAAELLTLRQLSLKPNILSFASGFPDPSLIPPQRFHEAWDAVLKEVGFEATAPSPIQGLGVLRELIADRLAHKGILAQPENVIVVSGSQQGLDLLTRLLAEPGDTVMCEAPTYFGALQAFQVQGLRVIGVPVDREGMDMGRVEALLARYRPRFIYTQPNYQNPTGTTMSLERREKLLRLAQRYQVPILEDDPFGDLWFDQPPPPAVKALDRSGHVIYLSTFSKSLAPGLRIGWLTAPQPLVDLGILLKRVADLQPNTGGQHLVVEFARRGWLDEILDQARPTYRRRCLTMDSALRKHLPDGAQWLRPAGGLFLWLELPEEVSAHQLLAEAGKEECIFMPGRVLYPSQGPRHVCRLNFTTYNEPTIEQGIANLGHALKRLISGGSGAPPGDVAASAVV